MRQHASAYASAKRLCSSASCCEMQLQLLQQLDLEHVSVNASVRKLQLQLLLQRVLLVLLVQLS